MSFERIDRVTGTAVHLPGDDIDTDRIIPGRFLRCVTFDGLGEYAFFDERFAPDGTARTHPLNDVRHAGAGILLTGRNFGCGSSREHAPQSLQRAGFHAVIAESFAEIFFGNSTGLGMVCARMNGAEIDELSELINTEPSTEITVDLGTKMVRQRNGFEAAFEIPDSARQALLTGRWDPLGQLMDQGEEVAAVMASLPYISWSG